jgi:outer membrane receptor protein involved in Fe transport
MAQTQPAPETTATPLAAETAEAPAQLDSVVVRSRNRIEKLQDVPLSISVVSGTELSRLNATGIDEVLKRAGNVSWNQGNQRTSSLSIRGIGKVGQTEAQDPSVGVMVDGVFYAYNALTSSFDFTDVDNVEVTRGPQGTLLGKNASVGIIAINTKRPSFTPSADYSLAFSQRDGFKGSLAAGGPVIDDLLPGAVPSRSAARRATSSTPTTRTTPTPTSTASRAGCSSC